MIIFYFDLVCFTFSISYSVLPFHLVYILQFFHLFFLMFFLKPLSSVVEKLLYAYGVAKSQTRLSDFTVTFHFHALEKDMATHSSFLAWRVPGTGEPGGLPSMGSHGVGHD